MVGTELKTEKGLEFLVFFKVLGSNTLVFVIHLKQTMGIVLIIIHKV